MDTLFIELIGLGILSILANVLGGSVLFFSRFQKRYGSAIKYLLAFGAGFMLAVAFFELIPRSIEIWQKQNGASLSSPMLLVLGGYLITQFFEHTIAPHFHLGEEVHRDQIISPRTAYVGVGGFTVHTFFDGVAIAAASQVDIRIGFLVFLAVFLHKIPEGFTIGSMVMAAGMGARQVVLATSLIGGMTLVGILLFFAAGSYGVFTAAFALPLACGVTIYVAASDLIPELNHHGGRRPLVSLSVLAGVAVFFAIHLVVHSVIES